MFKINSLMGSLYKTNSITSSIKWTSRICSNNPMHSNNNIHSKCTRIPIKTQMATLRTINSLK